jgi:hypothetical protein
MITTLVKTLNLNDSLFVRHGKEQITMTVGNIVAQNFGDNVVHEGQDGGQGAVYVSSDQFELCKIV